MILMCVVAFLATFLLMPLCRKLSFSFDILDIPDERKVHQGATPLLGGLGIYCGILVGMSFQLNSLRALLPIIVAATIIFVVGLVDDARGLSPKSRLFFQFVASMIVIISGSHIEFMPQTWWGNTLEVVITLIWIMGMVNAFNYLDGLDGLAAGSAIINLGCFAVILFGTQQRVLGIFALSVIAACVGFLPHNFKEKKIFLGDSGSTLLGFLLSVIAVTGSWAEDSVVKLSIPLLILGVPIFDMTFTTYMRIIEKKVTNVGEWLSFCGRDHFHHYLVELGVGRVGSVLFIYCVTLSFGMSAIMVSNDDAIDALVSLLQSLAIFCLIAILIVKGKRRSEFIHADKNKIGSLYGDAPLQAVTKNYN